MRVFSFVFKSQNSPCYHPLQVSITLVVFEGLLPFDKAYLSISRQKDLVRVTQLSWVARTWRISQDVGLPVLKPGQSPTNQKRWSPSWAFPYSRGHTGTWKDSVCAAAWASENAGNTPTGPSWVWHSENKVHVTQQGHETCFHPPRQCLSHTQPFGDSWGSQAGGQTQRFLSNLGLGIQLLRAALAPDRRCDSPLSHPGSIRGVDRNEGWAGPCKVAMLWSLRCAHCSSWLQMLALVLSSDDFSL